MHSIHKIVATFVLVALLAGSTGARALAAPAADTAQPPTQLTLGCDQAGCTAQAALPGVPGLIKTGAGALLSFLKNQANSPLGDASITLGDDLVIRLPAGEVRLPNAQVTLDLGQDNRVERLHGTAEVPFPSFGALEDVTVLAPTVAEVGLDSGAHLRHLDAPLRDDRQYLFFTFGSGLAVAAKGRGATSPFELSVPAGQNATLVVDTQEPMVYLAGNVTVTHDDQIALVGKLLEPIQTLNALPKSLPLRQRTQLAVSGQLGKQPEDRAFEIGAAHAVDAGVIGDWLGVEVRPLAVQGLLTVTRDGLLLQGVAGSSIAPDVLLDADARLDAFIPFSGELEDAYLLVQAHADVPVAKMTADATAKVTWPLDVETTSHVVRQGVEHAAARQSTELPAARPGVKQTLASAGEWAAASLHRAGDWAAGGGQWLARTTAAGAAAVAELASKADAK
jgi:hypothetical protein